MAEYNIISLISLAIAFLAVIVGPWISWRVAREQSRITLAVSNKQIIAPMRQAWIDKLRDKVGAILSVSWWYYISGRLDDTDNPDDETVGSRVEKKLRFLVLEVQLLLNPGEDDHRVLLKLLNEVVSSAFPGDDNLTEFPDAHTAAAAQAQRVFKKEWEVVKREGMALATKASSGGQPST